MKANRIFSRFATYLVVLSIILSSVCGVATAVGGIVVQPSKYTLPLTFEEQYNPFVSLNNVYSGAEHPNAPGIGLVTENTLNGDYSLKIDSIREGNVRTETSVAQMAGNPDFSKTEFDKVTGIMFRIKLENDSSKIAHSMALLLRQDGLSNITWLASGAVLYKANGEALPSSSGSLDFKIPAGFDGFVFLPFKTANSDLVYAPGQYTNYSNNPTKMVDVAKDYNLRFMFGSSIGDTSWGKVTVTLDDICYYKGSTQEANINTIIDLGYKPSVIPQPSKYTLPLTFEEQYNPFISLNNVYSGAEHPNASGIALVTDNTLNGKFSLRIDSIKEGNARTETSVAQMVGNPDFSKTEFDKVTGIMFRMKLENDSSKTDHSMALLLKQEGLINATWLASGAVLYNTDGEVITTASSNLEFKIPAGFDGFVFLPFETANSDLVYAPGQYSNYSNNPTKMVDVAKDYNLRFMFGSSVGDTSWGKVTVTLDDICYYKGSTQDKHINKMIQLGYAPTAIPQPERYNLPLTFEEQFNPFIALNNVYSGAEHPNAPGIALVTDNTLNGKFSLRIDSIREGNVRTETSVAQMVGNPDFSKTEFDKVTGIMFRMKLENDSSKTDHSMALLLKQDGLINATWLASGAVLFNTDGEVITTASSNLEFKIPVGFDGFVFLPFETANSDLVYAPGQYSNYSNNPTKMVDVAKDYNLRFMFGSSVGDSSWDKVTVTLDDICYYSGTSQADNLSLIKSLGYTGITAVAQPERYSFPLIFDDLFMPFTGINNVYDNAEHQTNTGIELVGDSEAMNGTKSVKISTIRSGNTRTESNFVKMSGINGFTADGFGGNTGVMLRLKIAGDKTQASHQFALRLMQEGVAQATNLGSAAVLYDLNGNMVVTQTVNLTADIPANFDGYVFMPFAGAQSYTVTEAGSYDKYSTHPDSMVNLSKDFTMALFFGDDTWNGCEVYIDDITLYTGSDQAEHLELIKLLGYKGITAVAQPSLYTLPFTFEDEIMPFVGVNNIYDNAEHQTDSGIELVGGSEAMNGTKSIKFETIRSGNSRTESNRIKMAGINGFSTTDFSKCTGIMMRIKITGNKTKDTQPFSLRFWQEGVMSPTALGRKAKIYNTEGYEIATNATNILTNLPANFDGYIFMPFEGAQSLTVTIPGFYDNYSTYPNSMVDLSKEFEMIFFLGDSTWNGCQLYIDDVKLYSGDKHIDILKSDYSNIKAIQQPDFYQLPITFDKGLRPWLETLDDGMKVWKEGKYGTAAALTYESTSISNRDGIVINFADDVAQESNYYTSNAPVKVEAGSKGFMIRLKTNAKATATFAMRTGNNVEDEDEIIFGKPALLFDKNGNSVDEAIGGAFWRGVYLPDEFDGFIFVPFSEGFVQALNTYTQNIDGWKFENQIRNLQLLFFGDMWTGSKVEIDYIGTYSDNQYLQWMENAGYELDYDTGLIPSQVLGDASKLFYYTTVLNETFDEESIEKLKLWNILEASNGNALNFFSRNNVSIDYGNLKLQYKKESVDGKKYTTGAIVSKEPYSYGYYEVSMKIPKIAGTRSRFSLVTENDFRQGGTTFEIDIAYLDKQYELITGYSYMKDGKPLARGGEIVEGAMHPDSATATYANAYHTYGLLYTYNYLRFYVDGVLVRVIENNFARGNVYIKIAGEVVGEISESIDPKNDSICIDYVRYWAVDSEEMSLYDSAEITPLSTDKTIVEKVNKISLPLAIVSAVMAAVIVAGYIILLVTYRKRKAGKAYEK